jgi:hypothetical protein
VQLEADLWVSLWIFPAPSVMGIIILARSLSYLGVAPTFQGVLESQMLGFLLLHPSCHLGFSKWVIFSFDCGLVIANAFGLPTWFSWV